MITPQEKIIRVTNKLGASDIKNQQGTTREIYDTIQIPITPATMGEFRFFDESNRVFPFSNINNGKLEVGEALAIEYFSMCVIEKTIATGALEVKTLEASGYYPILAGDVLVTISNSQVIKPQPITSTMPEFNQFSKHQYHNVYRFKTNVVLSPMISFAFVVRCFAPITNDGEGLVKYLKLTVGGAGSIFAPKTTF